MPNLKLHYFLAFIIFVYYKATYLVMERLAVFLQVTIRHSLTEQPKLIELFLLKQFFREIYSLFSMFLLLMELPPPFI